MTLCFTSLRTLATIGVAAFLLSGPALADDLGDASKLLRAGQHAQALERVNKILSATPRDPKARFLKGLILAEQGSQKEATDIFLALTKDYPDLPEPYNNLAVIYAAQGQYDKARAALEQSIRTHPSYATAYENLGDVYSKLASQAYDKALQIDSSNSAAKNKLSLVRELVGGTAAPSKPVAVAQAPKEAPKEAVKEPAKEAAKEAPKQTAAAEIKPAPAPEKPAAKAAEKPAAAAKGGEPDVLDAVNAWAKAWSARDADAYLAMYAKDFKTPGGEARGEWEKARRQRITAPKSIAVGVIAPKISMADGQASVTFKQSYKSDVLSATSTKTLVLVKSDGRWLIQQEKVAN